MEGVIPEQVSGTKESRLSQNEIVKLKGIRQTEGLRLLWPYPGLSAGLLYIYVAGPGGIGVSDGSDNLDFIAVRNWVIGVFFIAQNGYFYYLYRKTIFPLTKDIKKGTKLILFLHLEKREPFFNRYFIYTPLRKTRQLEISGEDYFRLKDGTVSLAIAPSSLVILELLNGREEIAFHLPV